MTDLDALIEAVEAGDADFLASDGWIEAWDAVAPSLQTYRMKSDGCSAAIGAYAAHHGSLDAALRLHEALLHERCVMSLTHSVRYDAKVCISDPFENEVWDSGAEWLPPARAWLLSILRKLKAQGEKE